MPTAVPLPQLVDLALGSPEVGAVNFNILHTLLHAMIGKLGLGDAKAELNDADREFLSSGTHRGKSAASNRDRDGDDSVLDESILSEYSAPGKDHHAVPYHKLESRVAELAKALQDLNALPKTNDFYGDGNNYRVPDMWQGMQLKKRTDANEEGIGKLMMMMQDMMKEMADQKAQNKKLQSALDGLLKGEIKNLNDRVDQLPTFDDIGLFVRWSDLEAALKGIRTELEKLNQPIPPPPERVVVEIAMQTDKVASRPPSANSRPVSRSSSGPSQELLDILETLGSISTRHIDLDRRVKELEGAPKPKMTEQMKNKMDKGTIGFTEDMLKELNQMKADVESLKNSLSKHMKDHDAIGRLQQMLKLIEAAIEKLNKTTQDLTDDCQDKDRKIKKLYGLCDGLERKKADKEYVDMEVDVKADKKSLEGKVNHDLFDDTTNEINRTIQEILKQLAGNSDEWKNMLAKLMNDIDGKLDRIELNPLKDWLEKKLKALSKKIQDGSLQWNDDEAAGLKKQLIQHYHCLSCDKPVNLMPTGVQQSNAHYNAMPANRSPRPYTTYELDQIRQHARSMATSDGGVDFYATSRQCGGSHTTTMPHQRFSRNFKEEVDVMGADGHIYRGRIERIDAKMPTKYQQNRQNSNSNQVYSSKSAGQPRPASARGNGTSSPQMRQYSAGGGGGRNSRPQSARFNKPGSEQHSAVTTPPPEDVMEEFPEGEITVAVPIEMAPVKVKYCWF